MDDVDVEACVAAVEDRGDLIWGIAVNTSLGSCGDLDTCEIMTRGMEVAGRTGHPLLFGSRM